jgi:hypothetical protein
MMASIACADQENRQEVEVNTAKEVRKAKEQTADIADAGFVDGMTGKIFHNYLQLRTALVRADATEASVAAQNMSEAFTAERAKIKQTAQAIATSENIEEQRQLFSNITAQLEPLFEDNLNEGTIYKQFCPMAFDNEGAYWFSNIAEIRNPYFGDKMLSCGRIDKEISK